MRTYHDQPANTTGNQPDPAAISRVIDAHLTRQGFNFAFIPPAEIEIAACKTLALTREQLHQYRDPGREAQRTDFADVVQWLAVHPNLWTDKLSMITLPSGAWQLESTARIFEARPELQKFNLSIACVIDAKGSYTTQPRSGRDVSYYRIVRPDEVLRSDAGRVRAYVINRDVEKGTRAPKKKAPTKALPPSTTITTTGQLGWSFPAAAGDFARIERGEQ